MDGGLGRFKTEEARTQFLELYDAAAERWPVPADELDIPTRYGSTRVRRWGAVSGSPVVLLHPHMGTSLAWYPLVDHFVGARMFAVDTIGALGRSVQTRPIDSADDYAAWMRDVLDGLGLQATHMVGYSEGGYVAMCCALGSPDRVVSLIAIEPAGAIARVRRRFIAAMVWAGIRAHFNTSVMIEFAQRLAPGVDFSRAEWHAMMTGMFEYRAALPMPKRFDDHQLRSMRVPTLLYMAAETELYDPAAAAARAASLMPDVEATVVDGAHHGLPFQFPAAAAAAILDFVGRHEPTA